MDYVTRDDLRAAFEAMQNESLPWSENTSVLSTTGVDRALATLAPQEPKRRHRFVCPRGIDSEPYVCKQRGEMCAASGCGKPYGDPCHAHPQPAPAPVAQPAPDGVAMIAAERQRQVREEGWTPEHDDDHVQGEMAVAASCYAYSAGSGRNAMPSRWPWHSKWWKPSSRIGDLVKAGALVAAEIDRLRRRDGYPCDAPAAQPAAGLEVVAQVLDGKPSWVPRGRLDSTIPEGAVFVLASAAEAALAQRDAELTQARMALGLLTTLAGSVEVDVNNPVKMAQEIEASVRGDIAQRDAEVAKLTGWFDTAQQSHAVTRERLEAAERERDEALSSNAANIAAAESRGRAAAFAEVVAAITAAGAVPVPSNVGRCSDYCDGFAACRAAVEALAKRGAK